MRCSRYISVATVSSPEASHSPIHSDSKKSAAVSQELEYKQNVTK